MNSEFQTEPSISDVFCIIARIKVHAYGFDFNPGYKLNCCSKYNDGCYVTFTLQNYQCSFYIGTLIRQEVFVRFNYKVLNRVWHTSI